MNKAALQELVEASVGSLRDCSEQYAALKDRHQALVARVAVLERALEEIAEHADLDRDTRRITEFDRYLGIARGALDA